MLEASFETRAPAEGSVVRGTIVAIENDFAVVDVGLKTEGRVSLKEFSMPGVPPTVDVGDEVEVYLERVENAMGEAVLSRDKARREESWIKLESAFNEQTRVTGVIFGRVKGGFTVDLDGAVAFLPGSQVDVRPMRDVGPLMNQPQPFQILKMDRRRGNIVVSRRAVLEERRAEERSSLVASLVEKQVVEGVVKNITDYGAFVDLGGVDGLLHVTDIAWRRVSHPTEVLSVGQTVTVQIIKINQDTQRISLGMKQLQTDPWEGVAVKYPPGVRFKGKVTNVTDYGAFVELEPGVEGLVHVSEMSWVKKNMAPSKIVTPGQEVDVQVLEVDSNKRRISLGLKQCMDNPWQAFVTAHPQGSTIEGEIKTHHGVRSLRRPRQRNRRHGASVRSVLGQAGRAGRRRLQEGRHGQGEGARHRRRERAHQPRHQAARRRSDGQGRPAQEERASSPCTVTEVNDGGIEVSLADGVKAFIRRSDLARDRADQRPERFGVGDKVDAIVTSVDKASRKISLSIKAREVAEEKEAVAQFGSSDSGASLGDILGAALKKRKAGAKDDDKDDKDGEE